jgi:hypothetical protein
VGSSLGVVRAGRTNRALEPLKSAPIYHIRVPISDIKGGLEGGFKGSRGRPCGPREPCSGTVEISPDIPYPSSDIRYKGWFGRWFQGLSGPSVRAARTARWSRLNRPRYTISEFRYRYKGWFGGWFQGLSGSSVWAARTALCSP